MTFQGMRIHTLDRFSNRIVNFSEPRRLVVLLSVILLAGLFVGVNPVCAAQSPDVSSTAATHAPNGKKTPPSIRLTTPTLQLQRLTSENGVSASGDRQIAVVGARVNRPLVIQLLDRDIPRVNVPVYYVVVSSEADEKSGGKGLTIDTAPPLYTDENGQATLRDVRVESLGIHYVVFFLDPADLRSGNALVFTIEGRSPMWVNWMLIGMAGGLALFLLGAKLTGDGLGRLVGPKMREIMGRLDEHPVWGVWVGGAMTFLMQSSSASTTMFVSFAGANTLNMRQALPLIFGSAIGTTITVQLLAFDIYRFALLAVVIGVAIQLFGKPDRKTTALGQGLLGFGLIFHGMHVMVAAVEPLRRLPWLAEALWAIKDHPGWALVFATILTAIVQSSAAVLGVVLALGRQELITPLAAVPIIFGANIGTTITALLASMGLTREARRVAVAHLMFKVLGVILFLPLMAILSWIGVHVTLLIMGSDMPLQGSGVARSIANIHTIFNVIIALLALPFAGRLEVLVRRMMPLKGSEKSEGKLKYVELPVMTNPALIFGAAMREISRMGRFVEEQMKASHDALFNRDEAKLDYVHRRDDKIDNLQRDITRYLTNMMRSTDLHEETDRFLGLIQIVNDIENIGDILDKNIAPLGHKLILQGLEFSPESEKDLRDFYVRVSSDLSTLFVAVATGDRETTRSVRSHRHALASYSQKLLISHLNRLQEGGRENLDTSSVYMDLVNYLQRIEFHIYRIAGIAAGEVTYHADDAARSSD